MPPKAAFRRGASRATNCGMMVPSRRKQLALWIAAATIATAALAFTLIRESGSVAVRQAPYVIGDARRGAVLFGAKQCSICHAMNGVGGRVAPDLSAIHPGAPAMGWLATQLWNHAPGMFRQLRGRKSYPEMNTQEMADILAFLFQAGNSDPPGNPSAGRRVFEQKGCVRCHSVGSSGGKSAPDLSVIATAGADEWMRAMWNHSQSMVGPVTEALGQWPSFSGSDMSDLVAYVGGSTGRGRPIESSGNPGRGWQVFQARCIQCHSVRGQGGNIGPELGPEHELPQTTAQFASVLWNHAPAMQRLSEGTHVTLPVLQKVEVTDLAAFLASLRYFEPTGSALVGERVFTVRGCAGCHGPDADGSSHGPRIRAGAEAYTVASFTARLWKHGPKMVDHTEELGIPWPILEPSDMGDLVSFLNSNEH
ncbi:MAG: c-type cytochrome [Bryobacteraceae bacterium]